MIAALCDDNKENLEALNTALQRIYKGEITIVHFQSGEALIKAYADGGPAFDVLFLDIEMGGMDGIDTANRIRLVDKKVIIVLVTSHTKHMQRSFVCQPFRFLTKPVDRQVLAETCKDIDTKLAETPTTFVFMEDKQFVRVFCEDILFFESRGHWLIMRKIDGTTHKIRKTMRELLATVDHKRFCQVHRAFVVNIGHVLHFGGGELFMREYKNSLPIGRTYKSNFEYRFLKFEERRYFL